MCMLLAAQLYDVYFIRIYITKETTIIFYLIIITLLIHLLLKKLLDDLYFI